MQGLIPVGTTNPISFGIAIVTTIISVLSGIGFGGSDVSALAGQVAQLRDQVASALDWLKRFAWRIATALGALLQAVQQLIVGFLDKLWGVLKRLLQRFKDLLHDFLPNLLKIIRNLRKWMQEIYLKYIRPALNILQVIRRYLFILRIFFPKLGAKLDAIILRIEARIIGPYLWLLGQVNGIGQWINVILTARGIIQKPIFTNTMYAYQGTWVNMFWNSQLATGGPPKLPPAAAASIGDSNAAVQASWDVYAQTGGGPMADVIQQSQVAAASVGFAG